MATTHAIRQVIFEIPADVPYFENEDTLVHERHSCTTDYHVFPPPQEQYIACSLHLEKKPFESLATALEDGDGEKIIDLGLRYYSGCTVERNIERAIDTWEAITNFKHRFSVPEEKLTANILGQAYSCLADAHLCLVHAAFEGRTVSRIHPKTDRMLPEGTRDEIMANDFMLLAATYADAAVGYGVVTQAVLGVARYLVRGAERNKIEIRTTERYKPFKDLWHAFDVREVELAEDRAKRDAKVSRAPNAYTCAAPGCGLIAGKKKSFMRCAGKCPPERKPHYCSKDCQRRDWRSHKPYCKPDAQLDRPLPWGDSEDVQTGLDVVPFVDLKAPVSNEEGPDRAVEIPLPGRPGETVTFYSQHLTPDIMRYMRDSMEERRAGRQARAPNLEAAATEDEQP
ncbi:uncharacterized protein TRAVEDRAFT_73185 [Trametes versicolor FP-101664 SS1]|uniref:uncharacterized protein n=1 Tax=Trametes versicolor (strain FP-101664) TaxID=717944 RepID=UPI0004622D9C|nr:uncharacterized protein TRAVEDRAFT_73185 [Trametes versicolor FP-101664 SS1]EIW56756.1 hypothetical protein TRAVEDRAFT_73185 [Trametes versicolor FP-101664 SS1]